MINRKASLLICCLGSLAAVVVIAQQHATEAPAGFTTPTLVQNPGSQSVSNGMVEPRGDTFALDQQRFEQQHDDSPIPAHEGGGLGPVFNDRSCAGCHQNVVTGAAAQTTEVRVGHKDAQGNFVNPTVLINGGANSITGRSLIDDRAVCEAAHEHVPETENIRTLRAVLNTLGDGFAEAVGDKTLLEIAARQPALSHGLIHGEAIEVPILEAPTLTRLGRFGWKDQEPTVLSFAADAYLNEMGITSRLRPKDITTVCKTSTDPEDTPDDLGLADIDHFAQFVRGTQAPPRDTAVAATPDAVAGEKLFATVGCNTCHVDTLITDPPGTVVVPGVYSVPEALGNKVIHPYSDFLLHDVGTGDGIVQAGPQDTANKLRTVPLWGLHIKSRFMHDLKSLTLEAAVSRHRGEARDVRDRFFDLDPNSQQQIITFLKSL